MRIVLWHPYLLAGTGSNIFTRSLSPPWSLQAPMSSLCVRSPIPSAMTSGPGSYVHGWTGVSRCSCRQLRDMVPVWRPDMRVEDHDGSVQSTPEPWEELPDDRDSRATGRRSQPRLQPTQGGFGEEINPTK